MSGAPNAAPDSLVVTPTGETIRTNPIVPGPDELRRRARAAGYPEWALKDEGFLFAFSKGMGVDQDTGEKFNLADRWIATSQAPPTSGFVESIPTSGFVSPSAAPAEQFGLGREWAVAEVYRKLRQVSPQDWNWTPHENASGAMPEVHDDGQAVGVPYWEWPFPRGKTVATAHEDPKALVAYAYPTRHPRIAALLPQNPSDMTHAPAWLKEIERWRQAKIESARQGMAAGNAEALGPVHAFTADMAHKINTEIAKNNEELRQRREQARAVGDYLRNLGIRIWGEITASHPMPEDAHRAGSFRNP